MRTGYEDWEFFIRAMRRGLRGVPAGRCGFRYRRRAFSMVERSMRDHESLLEQIRARHPDAYSPRALARREHEALPRFALVDPSLGSVELTASVDLPPGSSTLDELIAASDLDSDSRCPGTGRHRARLARRLRVAARRAPRRRRPAHGPASPLRPRERRPEAPGGGADAQSARGRGRRPADSSARDSHREAGRRLGAGHRCARHRARGGRPCANTSGPTAGWAPDLGDGRRAEHGSAGDARGAQGAPEGRVGAATHARFAAELHLDRFETTLPWTGEPARGSRAFFVLAPPAGPRPEFMRWLWALRRSEREAAVHPDPRRRPAHPENADIPDRAEAGPRSGSPPISRSSTW